jgi:His/Glu/Gln/Arg/opine family amino acid ABC transporter permease subunit
MVVIPEYLPSFLQALLTTLELAAISGIIALLIGIAALLLLALESRPIRRILEVYTDFFRATPLLVQLYFTYYGLPVLGINISPFTSAVIAFSLNTGAYVTEIMRGGQESIDRGQFMAAYAMGMSTFECLSCIIIPQVIRRTLSPLITQFSYLIKDTSLAAVLVVMELTYAYRNAASITFRPFESLFVPMIFYLLLYALFKLASTLVERRRGEAR